MSENQAKPSESIHPDSRKKFPYLLVSISLVVVIGCTIALLVPNIWSQYKTLRAQRVVAEADRLIEEGNPQEAFKVLTKSYSQHPFEPQYLRAIAKFLQKAGAEPARTLHFWRQLSVSGHSTYEDLVEYGITLSQSNDAGEARRVYENLSEEDKAKPRSLELLAYILMAEGDTTRAESLLKEALSLDSDNAESRFKLARIEMRNPFFEVQQKAYEDMWKLARGTGKESVAAIELLASDAKLTAPQAKELLELLSNNSRSNSRIYYTCLQAYVRLFPAEQKERVDAEIKKQEGKPYEGLFDFYRWLYLVGEHDHLIKLMPREVATKVREMFPIYMEVLASKQEWKTIQEILKNNPTLPASPTDLALLRARCAHGLNEGTDAIRAHLVDACRAALATRDMNNFNRTTQITERLGYPDIALEAYRNASTIPQYQLMMLERIAKLQASDRNASSQYVTLKEIVTANAQAYDHREQALYLSLLLGDEIELSLRENDLLQTAPKRKTQKAFIDSLIAFRYHDLASLKEHLTKVKQADLTTGQKAVVAGLFAVAGDVSAGFNIAEKINPSLILEEEARFLRLAL